MYAIKLILHEVKTPEGVKMRSEDEVAFLVNAEYGATSRLSNGIMRGVQLPLETMVFPTPEQADDFMDVWQPHPWCTSVKEYKVIPVIPRHIQNGWEAE